jgi:predicted RNase H-like HicB family nuclease
MLDVEVDRELDGRWIAEVTDVPGALAYGTTQNEAIAAAKAIAMRELQIRRDDLQSSSDVG